jgi:hypothetical protein
VVLVGGETWSWLFPPVSSAPPTNSVTWWRVVEKKKKMVLFTYFYFVVCNSLFILAKEKGPFNFSCYYYQSSELLKLIFPTSTLEGHKPQWLTIQTADVTENRYETDQ